MPKLLVRNLSAIAIAGSLAGTLHVTANATEPTTLANIAPATANTLPEEAAALAGNCALVFSRWAGSTENARALLLGLHRGTAVTLTQPATAATGTKASTTVTGMSVSFAYPTISVPESNTGSETLSAMRTTADTATTFTAPTKSMSIRHACIALAIARQELAIHSIALPAPAQIHAVLDGGTITVVKKSTSMTAQLPGILNLRASGMGWEQIAQRVGVSFGRVVAELKRNPALRNHASIRTASAIAVTETID